MRAYRWHGINANGTTVSGTQEATSQANLASLLLERQIALIDAHELSPLRNYFYQYYASRPATDDDLRSCINHLATLLHAGIPLSQSLATTAKTTANRNLAAGINATTTGITAGLSLQAALGANTTLPAPLVQLIGLGEQTGTLPAMVTVVGTMLDDRIAHKKLLMKACLSPAITLGVAVLVTGLTIFLVLPQFGNLYQTLGVPQPPIIRYAMILQAGLTSPLVWLFLIILCGGLVVLQQRTQQFSSWFKTLRDRTPVISTIIRTSDAIRLLQTLQSYLETGQPLTNGLEHATNLVQTGSCHKLISTCQEAIRGGKSLGDALELDRADLFPPVSIALIRVGEATGTLSAALGQAITQLQQQLATSAERFTTTLAPLLTIGVGLLVGGLLAMLYIPILKLGSLVKF